MKVGTDGVLLGAWANATSYPNNILDIGTGTGLIAIMLAQRFKNSFIQAIEIDAAASQEALSNSNSSCWSNRITVIHCSLQDFNPISSFDLIVCNPPYFNKTTKSKNNGRLLARNNDTLNLEYLIKKSCKLLTDSGVLALIIPSNESEKIKSIAKKLDLFILRICWVKGNPNSPIKRLLISLSKEQTPIEESYLIIENSRHNYTTEYKSLCKDFYLKF